jgi:6-bladed beta-propeller
MPVQRSEIPASNSIQISQTVTPLLYAADFVVAEDGVILITDAKDGNIKCYDSSGKLLNIIGRRGPGPEEFLGPSFCDYQAPFLSILDGARKIHVYERLGRTEFSKIGDVYCLMCTSDVILSGKRVLVDNYIHQKDRGAFFLTLRELGSAAIRYLLPIERRYGYDSAKDYKANYDDLSKLSAQRGFLTISGNRIFYVFDVRPKIIGVNLDGSGIATFGGPSPNYREPRINQIIRKAFSNEESESIKREREKVSYITGILSNKDMVGVLFSNYDASSDIWKLYLQRYDTGGNFESESLLREATNYGSFFHYYFQKETCILFVMTERYGDETDDYRLLEYKLK